LPEAWSPGGDFGSPTYSLPIRVVDYARSTFIGEHRQRWREACDLALQRWELPFTLEHPPETEQAYAATEETISNLGVNPLIVPNAIALVRFHVQLIADSAGWIQEMGGGICLFVAWRGWWKPFPAAEVTRIITHEVGHCLGFGHGGNGVMVGSIKPNLEERALASAYYQGG
jgi:hypothetical protein